MIVVDMQVGLLNGEPKHDLRGVIERINRLAAKVRERSGMVIFIQHCGGKGDDFEPETPGWAFLPELVRDPADIVVQKTLNDPFAGTDLAGPPEGSRRTGSWSRDGRPIFASMRPFAPPFQTITMSSWSTDAHTLNDRPHLDAASVIRHHHWVWSNLITQRSVRLARTDELLL